MTHQFASNSFFKESIEPSNGGAGAGWRLPDEALSARGATSR
jgi:hypothetical protein